MAYVNFWKGPAADYVAETHGEGIYQCTDTGDTYIFGVKNSGSGGGTEDYVTQEELTQGLAGKANTSHTHNISDVSDLQNQLNNKAASNHTHSNATDSAAGFMSASDKSKLDSLKGTNSNQSFQTGVSNIPLATYGIQLRQTGSNSTLSFSGSLSDGQELHVIIRNTNSSAITITFPSSSSYISMSGDSMEIPGNGYLEVNVLRAGSYYYLRAAASLE